MTGYQSKRAAAQDKLVVTDIDGHVVRDARKSKKAQPAQEPWPEEPFGHMAGGVQPPQRPWVDLTEDQIKVIEEMALTKQWAIRMTIAQLKECNA